MSEFASETFNEIFSDKIMDKMFQTNAFLNTFENHSEFLEGRTVHIPQYVSTPDIYVDGVSTLSGTYGYGFNTVDVQPEDLSYIIQSFRIPTFRVTDFQEALNKPSILDSIGRNEIASLTEVVANKILFNIGSGIVGGNKLGLAGASLSYLDMLGMAQKLAESSVIGEAYLLITPAMYYALLNDPQVIDASKFGSATLPSGVVNKIAGINIMIRPTVLKTDGSGNVVSTGGTTDAGILYVSSSISAAWKDATIYTSANVPQLYGNAISGEMFAGASIARKDGKGVFLIENV